MKRNRAAEYFKETLYPKCQSKCHTPTALHTSFISLS